MALPRGTTGSLSPSFLPARRVSLAVKLPYCLYTLRTISNRAEGTFVRLRYILGGDRPSQTTRQARSPKLIFRVRQPDFSGWYFTGASTKPKSLVSTAPTYATQRNPDINARL